MANEKFTQLPTVANSTLADIIAAVQSGTSVQQTLQQVYSLFLSNTILSFAGDPNGNVAGTRYQLCWDTTNSILYVCTTSGNSSTAVWTSSSTGNFAWEEVTTANKNIVNNTGYIVNRNVGVEFFLPTTAAIGDEFRIVGKSGIWSINTGAGQQIKVGTASTTVGVGGTLIAFNETDSASFVCITSNTIWQVNGSPQTDGFDLV